jgi:hypothetical protein
MAAVPIIAVVSANLAVEMGGSPRHRAQARLLKGDQQKMQEQRAEPPIAALVVLRMGWALAGNLAGLAINRMMPDPQSMPGSNKPRLLPFVDFLASAPQGAAPVR